MDKLERRIASLESEIARLNKCLEYVERDFKRGREEIARLKEHLGWCDPKKRPGRRTGLQKYHECKQSLSTYKDEVVPALKFDIEQTNIQLQECLAVIKNLESENARLDGERKHWEAKAVEASRASIDQDDKLASVREKAKEMDDWFNQWDETNPRIWDELMNLLGGDDDNGA
jgi:chromosome segregation ATPase